MGSQKHVLLWCMHRQHQRRKETKHESGLTFTTRRLGLRSPYFMGGFITHTFYIGCIETIPVTAIWVVLSHILST